MLLPGSSIAARLARASILRDCLGTQRWYVARLTRRGEIDALGFPRYLDLRPIKFMIAADDLC